MAINYLKGVTAIGQPQTTEVLLNNVMYWLDWGFLTVGGYFNVQGNQSGAFGGLQNKLRPANDPSYTDGQVWEGFRSNWVWESGVNLQFSGGTQPIAISGVTVNGTFYASNTSGTYAHYIDYPNGRVVFDSAISTTADVRCNYSYKWVSVKSVDSPEFRQLMFESMRVDDPTFPVATSGNWNQHPTNRVQMPVVFVEILNSRSYQGLQLGGGQKAFQNIYFHIFTEEPWTRNNIVDAISNQGRSTIKLFNLESGVNSVLDYRGALTATTKTYPQLINLYPDGDMFILESDVKNVMSTTAIFKGLVRWEGEIWLVNI